MFVIADNTDIYTLLLHISNSCGVILYFRQVTESLKRSITYHNLTAVGKKTRKLERAELSISLKTNQVDILEVTISYL